MAKKATVRKATEKKPRAKIDNSRLRVMLEEDKSAKEIMTTFGLTSPAALRNKVLQLSIEDNRVYKIPGLFGRRETGIKNGKLGIRVPANKLPAVWQDKDFDLNVDEETGSITLSLVQEAEA